VAADAPAVHPAGAPAARRRGRGRARRDGGGALFCRRPPAR
jgi:hypothetical protein